MQYNDLVLNIMPFNVCVINITTYEIVYMNRAMIEHKGFCIGQCCYKAFYDEDKPCFFCKNKQLINKKGDPLEETTVYDFFNEHDDQWYQMQEQAFILGKGKIVKCSIAIDISELKRTQNKLTETHAKLALQNKELANATLQKSAFLANMSHEIRTPMNAIIGLSHLALKTDLTFRQNDYLTKISQASDSLLHIINDILDFSKIEASKLELEKVEFNLSDIIDMLSSIFYFQIAKKNIELIAIIDEDVPYNLIGDPLRLKQILINLINNAIKFTEHGEIIVRVSRSNTLASSSSNFIKLCFSVADTGIGISESIIPYLFKSFNQADNSTTRQYGGTGLGLAISKQLVELMKGEIKIESKVGHGSNFIFDVELGLPVTVQDKPVLPVELKHLNALVVDDNAVSRKIIAIILTSLTLTVTSVASAEDALMLLKSHGKEKPFDILILDWMLEGMNGIELCKIIRDIPETTALPIIMISAQDKDGELANKLEQIKNIIFRTKPLHQLMLRDAIAEIFNHSSHIKNIQKKDNNLKSDTIEAIKGANVLLVDDNDINQQVATELMKNIGLIVTVADNGKQAVDLFLKRGFRNANHISKNNAGMEPFDIILMDIQMPIMDGFEATLLIREYGKANLNKTDSKKAGSEQVKIPIIAMTAHIIETEKKRCLEVGMDDFLTKPIVPNLLYAALSRWIAPVKRKTNISFNTSASEINPDNINKFPENLVGINIESGLERVAGNKKLYKKLLHNFLINNKNSLKQLQSALKNSEIESAAHLAHALKGVSGNLGIQNIFSIAGELETAIKQNSSELYNDLLKKLNKNFKLVFQSLENWFAMEEKHLATNKPVMLQRQASDMSV